MEYDMQGVPSTIKTSDKNTDRFDAPVLWIKKTFGSSKEHIIERTLSAFKNADISDVKIVELYITTKKGKDHAYMLLNSSKLSE